MRAPSRDQMIADAKSVADLMDKAQTFDPQLAKQLTAKPLLASKSVWGMALTALLTPLITSWGFGWDEGTVELVSGIIVVLVAAALRSITAGPISGITSSKPSA